MCGAVLAVGCSNCRGHGGGAQAVCGQRQSSSGNLRLGVQTDMSPPPSVSLPHNHTTHEVSTVTPVKTHIQSNCIDIGSQGMVTLRAFLCLHGMWVHF